MSNTGTWMQRVAQDWLVLTVLTAHDSLAVGITTGLQFLPVPLLGPVAGLLADRVDRRRLLVLTQAGMGLTSLALGVLVVSGTARLWEVYVLAFLSGAVSALDAPARQTFVAALVPADLLPNAVALNSASFHTGRLLGPGVAGLLIEWVGTGPVFLVNAVSFAATITSLTGMRRDELRFTARAGRARGQIRAGLAYVRGRPDIMAVMFLVGMTGTFGMNFQITTALMATSVYGKGAGEYGLLGSIMAVGSLGGALLAARRGRPRVRLLLGAAAVFGCCCLLSSAMPTYATFAAALVPVGLSSLTLMTAANATVQLATAPEMRGRVMALYVTILMGGTPLGAPVVGWIGQAFGARWTIAVGGAVTLASALLVLAVESRRRRVRVGYALSPRPHLVVQPRGGTR